MSFQEICSFFIHSIFNMGDTTKGALFGIVGALLGVFLGGIISKNSAIDIMRRQRFNKAASEFWDAFTGEQIRISRETPSVVTYGIAITERSAEDFASQETAMVRFRYFIHKSDTTSFDKAWRFYANDWHKWMQECSDNNDKGIEDFLSHYFKILEYAKPR